jgi:hypothetical protein
LTLRDIDDALKQESCLVKFAIEETYPTTFAQEATTLAFALATPHTVIDVTVERVDETLARHRTGRTDSLGDDDAHSVAGKEGLGGVFAALSIGHPLGTHTHLLSHFLLHSSDPGDYRLLPFDDIFTSAWMLTSVLEPTLKRPVE